MLYFMFMHIHYHNLTIWRSSDNVCLNNLYSDEKQKEAEQYAPPPCDIRM